MILNPSGSIIKFISHCMGVIFFSVSFINILEFFKVLVILEHRVKLDENGMANHRNNEYVFMVLVKYYNPALY